MIIMYGWRLINSSLSTLIISKTPISTSKSTLSAHLHSQLMLSTLPKLILYGNPSYKVKMKQFFITKSSLSLSHSNNNNLLTYK